MAIPSTRQIAAAVLLSFAVAASAHAARVAVLSNAFSSETAANFNATIPGDTFTGIDVSSSVPSLATLLANYDVILLFEDSTFANSPVVGNQVAAFANAGRAVVLGTFYDQDRSDATGGTIVPHGWGNLELIDPDTTDGVGTAYAVRTLNPASIVPSPLTQGVASLSALLGNPGPYAGGNQAKPGTIVVANWLQPNARGLPDPAIAFRVTGKACVIQIGIAAQYPVLATYNVYGSAFGGDFYQVWKNAFDFGAAGCPTTVVPGDPNQIAKGWANRDEFDFWRTGFTFAIILDGAFIQGGFGPALQLTTHPDGTITFG
ncbi:MAG: hypothetical protein KGJ99_06610 [Betaproteobacteria bacterium]|nr:hypothetical protein [Betaproteobacteria bacterium]